MRRLVLVMGLAAAVPAHAAASRPYESRARVAYVREALAAVHGTRAEALQQAEEYLGAMRRGACSSAFSRLAVECLLAAARRYCKAKKAGPACPLYADVAASNALAEDYFITADERYRLMQQRGDYRRELRRSLDRARGELAVDLRLSSPRCRGADLDCLAGAIDGFCLRAGDARNLPWQSCAASLIWFVGAAAAE